MKLFLAASVLSLTILYQALEASTNHLLVETHDHHKEHNKMTKTEKEIKMTNGGHKKLKINKDGPKEPKMNNTGDDYSLRKDWSRS